MRRLLALALLPACFEAPSDDDEGREDDDAVHTWTEVRTVTIDFGCTFTVRGEGVEVTRERPDLLALCDDCEHIFEVRTDIDRACDDTVQVVDPYYRGTGALDGETIALFFGAVAPTYDADTFVPLAEVENTGWRMPYTYAGDLGVPDGAYTVDAVLILE